MEPGDLVDTHFPEELSPEEFYEKGLIDNPGRASIGFPAMPVLYTTATHDTVEITIRNQGKATDTFEVVLQAGQFSQTRKVELKGGQEASVEFVILGGTIPAGTIEFIVTATSANGTKSVKSHRFTVLAPTENEAQAAIKKAETRSDLSDYDRAILDVLRTVRDPKASTVVTTAPTALVQAVNPTPTPTAEASSSSSAKSNDTTAAVVVSVLVTAFALLGGIGFAAYNNLIPGFDANQLLSAISANPKRP